jgi:acylphosphatase
MAKQESVAATVTGNDQHVGFRAAVMKQAIEYNLAGWARNDTDQIVRFVLQGDKHDIDSAIATLQQGTKKSSDIQIATSETAFDPALKGFTIVDWTSTSRNITTPYTLVFPLRADDGAISTADAKATWRQILESSLDAEDLKKLQPGD